MSQVSSCAGDHDLGAQQPAARLAHRGERLGQQLVQRRRHRLLVLLLQLVELVLELLALDRIGTVVLGAPDLVALLPHRAHHLLDPGPEPGRLRLDVVVRELPQPRFVRVDLLHEGTELLHFAIVATADERAHQLLQHSGLKFSKSQGLGRPYNPFAAMYSATTSGTR